MNVKIIDWDFCTFPVLQIEPIRYQLLGCCCIFQDVQCFTPNDVVPFVLGFKGYCSLSLTPLANHSNSYMLWKPVPLLPEGEKKTHPAVTEIFFFLIIFVTAGFPHQHDHSKMLAAVWVFRNAKSCLPTWVACYILISCLTIILV